MKLCFPCIVWLEKYWPLRNQKHNHIFLVLKFVSQKRNVRLRKRGKNSLKSRVLVKCIIKDCMLNLVIKKMLTILERKICKCWHFGFYQFPKQEDTLSVHSNWLNYNKLTHFSPINNWLNLNHVTFYNCVGMMHLHYKRQTFNLKCLFCLFQTKQTWQIQE